MDINENLQSRAIRLIIDIAEEAPSCICTPEYVTRKLTDPSCLRCGTDVYDEVELWLNDYLNDLESSNIPYCSHCKSTNLSRVETDEILSDDSHFAERSYVAYRYCFYCGEVPDVTNH